MEEEDHRQEEDHRHGDLEDHADQGEEQGVDASPPNAGSPLLHGHRGPLVAPRTANGCGSSVAGASSRP